jgi:hypothetical protein
VWTLYYFLSVRALTVRYTYCMAEDSGISWRVDTHEHKERTNDWYWGLGLIAATSAILAVIFGNALFAVIIILGLGSVGVLVARGPREHEVRVTTRGLHMDGTLYRWDKIESFWIEEQNHEPHLLLTTQGVLHPQLVIPIGDPSRARNLREYLRRIVKEEEQEAHLGHHVAEMLGL